MGKRQHQKDKMYLTYTEWTDLYGGKKFESSENEHIKFKRLPFDHCSITMIPFETPYCDLDGNIFELKSIIDFIKKYKKNPITGKKISDINSLIKLNFYKNNDGNYHCPALFKPFTKNSHIVANAKSGNVYSFEAVEQLNIKTKNWKDLIDDTVFTRKDLITIQDPNKLDKFDITKFYHIQKKLRIFKEDDDDDNDNDGSEKHKSNKSSKGNLKKMNTETADILQQLDKDYVKSDKIEYYNENNSKKELADKFNAAHYSTGEVAASFTSTAIVPSMTHQAAIINEDIIKYERVKKKGYVRLITNFGPLNFELYCNSVPKACENFIKHCANGYYDGTKFHRSIRNFMIQGGDPTGTGTGGKSIWNKKFEDEFRANLSHTGRGMLSMANSGPNTNSSQFFITYRSCRYLDGKHTIFGKLVGGIDTLNSMEQVEVDNKDCPIVDIIIQRAQVFVDPFQEAEEQLANERAEENAKKLREIEEIEKKKRNSQPLKVFRDGVGKYLDLNNLKSKITSTISRPDEKGNLSIDIKEASNTIAASIQPPAKKLKNEKTIGFGDFSSW